MQKHRPTCCIESSRHGASIVFLPINGMPDTLRPDTAANRLSVRFGTAVI